MEMLTKCDCQNSQDCKHPWPIQLDPARIQEGDHVRHGPTGEDWGLLGVNEKIGNVCVGGWPATVAKLSDCTLVKKGSGITVFERNYRNRTFGSGWDGEV